MPATAAPAPTAGAPAPLQAPVRAQGRVGRKSIRTKLSLSAAAGSALVLIAIVAVTLSIVSSTLGDEITKSGVSLVQARRETGRLYAPMLEQKQLLNRLSQTIVSSRRSAVQDAYKELLVKWGYVGGYKYKASN
ncbi:MAG: hypothetical protein KDB07_07535, partial [Planctomycetes bacterium]|nr:hypothetical protein [Planctomycetota bacterium]